MLGSRSLFLMRWSRNNLQIQSTHFCWKNPIYLLCSSIYSSAMSSRNCKTLSMIQRYTTSCCEQIRSFSASGNDSSSSSTSTSEFFCERLSHRCLVKMAGRDVFVFLQGLITNDVRRLESANSWDALYSMILNVQGRVLYDIILYKLESNEPAVLLECDSGVTSELISSLEKYKLRKKLRLSDVGDELQVSAVFSKTLQNPLSSELPPLRFSDKKLVSLLTVDPRLKTFAYRLLAPANVAVAEIVENCERVTGVYHMNRYKVGLSEGIWDLPPGQCLPLESNLTFLNGVSFDKGCYIGQELTARTRYTGVIRKRLMPLILTSDTEVKPDASVENSSGKVCGKVRNVMGKYGLALLRLEEVVGKQQLIIKDGDKVVAQASTFIPSWWDTESDAVLKQIAAKRQVSEEDLKQEL